MRGVGGTGQRWSNSEYLKLFDYLFEKNQASAFPAPRKVFYNIAQQIFYEVEIMFHREGPNGFFSKYQHAELNNKIRRKSLQTLTDLKE